MAEAVGRLIAAAASIIKTCKIVTGCVDELQNAPNYIADLKVDIIAFSIFIEGIEKELRHSIFCSKPFFEQASVVIEDAKNTLRKLKGVDDGIQKANRNDLLRLKWGFNKQKFSNMKKRLTQHQTSLEGILNIAHAESSRYVKRYVKHLVFMQEPNLHGNMDVIEVTLGRTQLLIRCARDKRGDSTTPNVAFDGCQSNCISLY